MKAALSSARVISEAKSRMALRHSPDEIIRTDAVTSMTIQGDTHRHQSKKRPAPKADEWLPLVQFVISGFKQFIGSTFDGVINKCKSSIEIQQGFPEARRVWGENNFDAALKPLSQLTFQRSIISGTDRIFRIRSHPKTSPHDPVGRAVKFKGLLGE